MTISAVKSATTSGYAKLQRQSAERAAQQLEAKARQLGAEVATARKDADAADQRARNLEIQSGVASTSAVSAKQAVSAAAGLTKAGEAIGVQAERIAKSIQSSGKTAALYGQNGNASPAPSYKPGSIVSTTS